MSMQQSLAIDVMPAVSLSSQACGAYPLWAGVPQERRPPFEERSRFATLVTPNNERVRY